MCSGSGSEAVVVPGGTAVVPSGSSSGSKYLSSGR